MNTEQFPGPDLLRDLECVLTEFAGCYDRKITMDQILSQSKLYMYFSHFQQTETVMALPYGLAGRHSL
jgi:hypothetical protein